MGVHIGNDTRDRRQRDFNAFAARHARRKTAGKVATDECYTPAAVYEAVKGWVLGQAGGGYTIVRPFRPDGDYEAEEYPPDALVLDNPPFSMSRSIASFYLERGVKFFLFAPGLSLFTARIEGITYVSCDVTIRYHNDKIPDGVKVNTGFLTNLFPGFPLIVAPSLRRAINNAQGASNKVYRDPAPEAGWYQPAAVAGAARRLREDVWLPEGEAKVVTTCRTRKSFGFMNLSEAAAKRLGLPPRPAAPSLFSVEAAD